MKTIYIILALVAVYNVQIVAQSRVTNNSINTPRNYKMPINAKKAQENNIDAPMTTEYKGESGKTGTVAKGNYKATLGEKEDNGGLINVLPLEIEVNALASNRNYKTQKPAGKAKSSNNLPKQNKVEKDAVVVNK